MAKEEELYNRPSPKDEDEWKNAYKKQNPDSKKPDGYDISCVENEYGTKGHALLKPSDNRSRDDEPHKGKEFIPDSKLKKDK